MKGWEKTEYGYTIQRQRGGKPDAVTIYLGTKPIAERSLKNIKDSGLLIGVITYKSETLKLGSKGLERRTK